MATSHGHESTHTEVQKRTLAKLRDLKSRNLNEPHTTCTTDKAPEARKSIYSSTLFDSLRNKEEGGSTATVQTVRSSRPKRKRSVKRTPTVGAVEAVAVP